MTLGATRFEKYVKPPRREKFRTEMRCTVPCAKLCALPAPRYRSSGDVRPPKELEMMLRI